MEKFYDTIDTGSLMLAALDLGFDAIDLAVAVRVHLAPRVISWNDGCALGTTPQVSILVGCRYSCTFDRDVLYDLLDPVHAEHLAQSLHQHVDDLVQITVGSTVEEVVREVADAALCLHRALLSRHLRPSKTKSKYTTSRARSSGSPLAPTRG